MNFLFKTRIRLRNLRFRIKGELFKLYLLSCGCKVGRGIKCKTFPIMRTIPKKNITVGNKVNFGYRVSLDIRDGGQLIIGNNVNLTQDIVISALDKVDIGDDVLIAEYVSIRDGDHKYERRKKINQQSLVKSPIVIASDVWIGAGSKILKGANLKKGCIVAANSIILEKTITAEYNIYAGSPAKKIGERI